LVAGSKATLKPEKTPWSRPRVRPLAGMPAEESKVRILEASWGEPTEGKVAV
jgi:hypothetical protein